MRTARELFDLHLADLRKKADKKGLHFSVVLAAVVGEAPNRLWRTLADPEGEELVSRLIELYRPHVYELLADLYARTVTDNRHLLLNKDQVTKALKTDASRTEGGKVRGAQQKSEKADRHDRIRKVEAQLAPTTKPRALNKAIAKATKLETDYVRKACH